jgi:hypothetical protein
MSLKPEMVGKQYGWVEIISPLKLWNEKMNHCWVLTRCTGCGSEQWSDLGNLRSGRSRGCQSCSQPRRAPTWLYKRMSAAKQRCESPENIMYPEYGGRGICFCFPSVNEACLYMMALGPLNRDLEIDRIDTNGNYEPGNLRWVTRAENCSNQRRNVLSEWDQKYWPYTRGVVLRKLSRGETREQIIEDARRTVENRGKNWRTIEGRLKSMTYEMPDRITVLRYRGNSSTTVDTAAV